MSAASSGSSAEAEVSYSSGGGEEDPFEPSASESEDMEDLKDYKKGGYHPVVIGEALASDRYAILSKVGWGHFSTVWLAWDKAEGRPVTLKVQKSAQRYSEAARDEVDLLRSVAKSDSVQSRWCALDHSPLSQRASSFFMAVTARVLPCHVSSL